MAITDAGNLVQARENNGLVKAMLYVNADGTIIRCYNGIAHISTGNCGFGVVRGSPGFYTIDFGFQVNDRFMSITPQRSDGVNIATNFGFVATASIVQVTTFITDLDWIDASTDNPFMMIVY